MGRGTRANRHPYPAGTAESPQFRDPRDDTIYVICRSGARSARVTLALVEAGWQALNVEGGMQDWAAAGRPMISDTGAPPTVA